MGIRFDRDQRRATNGPMIFFSDPSSEIALGEEIRGAINSGLSFYCYRHPGDLMISFGSSEGFSPGIGRPGFVIAGFNPALPFITIPYKGISRDPSGSHGFTYKFPEISTSFDDYKNEIEGIKSILRERGGGKVVAARAILNQGELDPGATFFSLCKNYPEAYIFCFATPATGCWIGASPELLLQGKGDNLQTMALAGTREAGNTSPWDEKNIEEQQIVSDYILKIFQKNGLEAFPGETFTKEAGPVEHLCTPVMAEMPPQDNFLETLLKDLSPTPALCGEPKDMAMDAISRFEHFDRGCYGGFCGPFHSERDFLFNVVLRCASVSEKTYCLYAGGGITLRSEVASEWTETEMKAASFLKAAIFNH